MPIVSHLRQQQRTEFLPNLKPANSQPQDCDLYNSSFFDQPSSFSFKVICLISAIITNYKERPYSNAKMPVQPPVEQSRMGNSASTVGVLIQTRCVVLNPNGTVTNSQDHLGSTQGVVRGRLPPGLGPNRARRRGSRPRLLTEPAASRN